MRRAGGGFVNPANVENMKQIAKITRFFLKIPPQFLQNFKQGEVDFIVSHKFCVLIYAFLNFEVRFLCSLRSCRGGRGVGGKRF